VIGTGVNGDPQRSGRALRRASRALLSASVALIAFGSTAATAQSETKRISGTPGNDVIRGTPGRDVITSGGGNDVVYAGAGNDIVDAGAGDDTVRGEGGDDSVNGGDDKDILYGGRGADGLDGQGGRDILHTADGRGGNDSASGGPDSDICHGDPGDRHFSCASSADRSNGGGGTGPGGEDTASGRCQVTGRIVFADPLGFQPERTTFTDYAAGTCTGTVNGRFMADERVYLRAAGGGLIGCSGTRATSTGVLVFTRNTPSRRDDVVIDYTARSQGFGGQIVSRARGRVSGEVLANVRFRGDETTLRQCGAGTFRGGVYDMEGQTITPLVG
jgi:Ca2+-binding RTX toxin-like protein